MSSELKPCPFCGGEAKRKKYNGKLHRISCSICGIQTPIQEDDPVKIWNTRQPVDNWKPIEELKEEKATLIFYIKDTEEGGARNIYNLAQIVEDKDFKNVLVVRVNFQDITITAAKNIYTHYALLTPPKS